MIADDLGRMMSDILSVSICFVSLSATLIGLLWVLAQFVLNVVRDRFSTTELIEFRERTEKCIISLLFSCLLGFGNCLLLILYRVFSSMLSLWLRKVLACVSLAILICDFGSLFFALISIKRHVYKILREEL
ncbi:MAG: hypothetical protein DRN06_08010 [Thermoprotei archaeon]|nr:MAG: hypothetical protein DRN06_08010 [Thermoprotei archaeon]